ncbi:NACHT domain-containing protein [Micromonospora sp. NPDC003944]
MTLVSIELSPVVKILVSAAGKPILNMIKRQEQVQLALKRVGLNPRVPPTDFDGVYTYALVEHCYGGPEPVLKFFQNEYIKEAFRRSFESGDPRYLEREAEGIIEWNNETSALGKMDYDLRREFAAFTATFNLLVDRTRTAVETRQDVGLQRFQADMHTQLADLRETLNSVPTLDEIRTISQATIDHEEEESVSRLATDAKAWFDAIGYTIERESNVDRPGFLLVINVPARRRYDRIVVLGVSGEARHSDVELLEATVLGENADEGWVVAPRRVSDVARSRAEDSRLLISCYTFDELIDQDVDFGPYLSWLDGVVQEKGISDRYVPLGAFKQEFTGKSTKPVGSSVYPWDKGGLDGYVDTWLTDPSKDHLSVLGEFGTGKTWFTMHYAWLLSRKYIDACARGLPRPRLPLIIPLRDYAKAVSVESLFSEFFFRRHQVQLSSYKVFEQLNRMGRLLLIFDGFDEMAARIDRQAMINNFWELARAAVPGAKVLLTCRTEHFPEAREGRAVLGAQLKASTSALTGEPPQFEVIEIQGLTDAQVRLMLSSLTDLKTVGLVMANQTLLDLMRRPIMSELVIDALPEISGGSAVDMARVYLYAVRRKMARDISESRTFTSMADKLFFLAEVSYEMLSTDSMSLNYRGFPERIRTWFGPAVQEEKDLDHWHYDMLGQTMLIRNNDGDYTPAHRSLIEFFVAFKIAAQLGILAPDFMSLLRPSSGSELTGLETHRWSEYFSTTDSSRRTGISDFAPDSYERVADTLSSAKVVTPAVIDLLLPMVKPGSASQVVSYLQQARSVEDSSFVAGGNLMEIAVAIDPSSLAGVDLSGIRVSSARIRQVATRHSPAQCDLSGTSLANAQLRFVDFYDCILRGADMRGVNPAGKIDLGPCKRAAYSLSIDEEGQRVFGATGTGEIFEWTIGGLGAGRVIREESAVIAEIEYVGHDTLVAILEPGIMRVVQVSSGATTETLDFHLKGDTSYSHVRGVDRVYHVIPRQRLPFSVTSEEAAAWRDSPPVSTPSDDLELPPFRYLDVFDGREGHLLESGTRPPDLFLSYYCTSRNQTIHASVDGSVFEMHYSATSGLFFERITKIESEIEPERTIHFDGRHVWILGRVNNKERLEAYSPEGELLWLKDFPSARRGVSALDMTQGRQFAALSERHGIVVVSMRGGKEEGPVGLTGFGLDAPEEIKWSDDRMRGITEMRLLPEPGVLVSATSSGVIQARQMSGKVVGEANLSHNFSNLQIDARGLSSSQIYALSLGGARMV